ncbi:MAG: hypothetical protein NTX72_01470 [Candidatus Uhrbacteria bacterium]|nr:hypothetical protein [Candidatus Uhrbacteria bacterium]
MQKRVKPVSLRPMTREQKLWLALTILLFVVLMAVGWYYTVAQTLKRTFAESHKTISVQIDETKQQFVGKEDLAQKTQEAFGNMTRFFQNANQFLEQKQQAEQVILDNVKEELKQPSTH